MQQAAGNNDELSLKQNQATRAEHLTATAHGKQQQQQRFPSVVSESTHEQKVTSLFSCCSFCVLIQFNTV